MTLPAADFGNYSRLSATVAVQFPSSAATDVQTRETASRIAGLEKLMTLEFHCKLKPQPDDDDLTTTLRKLPACLILDAAGLRTFVREGNLLKVTKYGCFSSLSLAPHQLEILFAQVWWLQTVFVLAVQ
jgi:hypothetical protein